MHYKPELISWCIPPASCVLKNCIHCGADEVSATEPNMPVLLGIPAKNGNRDNGLAALEFDAALLDLMFEEPSDTSEE